MTTTFDRRSLFTLMAAAATAAAGAGLAGAAAAQSRTGGAPNLNLTSSGTAARPVELPTMYGDLGGLFLANRHQQDGGIFNVLVFHICSHDQASVIQLRTKVAMAAGFSLAKALALSRRASVMGASKAGTG